MEAISHKDYKGFYILILGMYYLTNHRPYSWIDTFPYIKCLEIEAQFSVIGPVFKIIILGIQVSFFFYW